MTYPVLETPEGELITETLAICQLLAMCGSSSSHLCGQDPNEEAQVDMWMSFLRNKTMALAKALAGAVYGTIELTSEEHTFLTNELKENLKIVNNQLKSK